MTDVPLLIDCPDCSAKVPDDFRHQCIICNKKKCDACTTWGTSGPCTKHYDDCQPICNICKDERSMSHDEVQCSEDLVHCPVCDDLDDPQQYVEYSCSWCDKNEEMCPFCVANNDRWIECFNCCAKICEDCAMDDDCDDEYCRECSRPSKKPKTIDEVK
jgi:hypothetical protein